MVIVYVLSVPSRGGDRRTPISVGPSRRQDGGRGIPTSCWEEDWSGVGVLFALDGRHLHRVQCEGAALFIPHRANAHHARLTLAPDV